MIEKELGGKEKGKVGKINKNSGKDAFLKSL